MILSRWGERSPSASTCCTKLTLYHKVLSMHLCATESVAQKKWPFTGENEINKKKVSNNPGVENNLRTEILSN